ncbi:RusA family crossover junction endodeoxyribonuclease [Agathobacter rectalis]|uniref:RusA family crossover junction endodeoxyribonuclease n=1 Tax=Agathobacter rectalis TaxID=39491 RepID=UPI0034A44AC5
MEYLLIIPGRLNNLNDYISAERANRYKGAQMKADNEAVVKAAITRSLRGVYIQKKVRMEYLWVEKNQRRDLDNISSFGRKVIQDELVKSRILQNDGWANIIGFSDSFAVDKQDPRIEVRIIEVDE